MTVNIYNQSNQSMTPRATFGRRNQTDQMRLVALQNGEIRHVNHAFAKLLGLGIEDVKGRNLLDMVLFQNADELKNDRGLFNQGETDNYGLNGLQSGAHILLLGANQDPYNFFFDWVENNEGKRYLIASSFKDDKPIEWTHYREEQMQSDLSVEKKNEVGEVADFLPKRRSHFLKAAIANDFNANPDDQTLSSLIEHIEQDDFQIEKTARKLPQKSVKTKSRDLFLSDNDRAIFAELSHDLKCILSSDGAIVRMNDLFQNRIECHNGDHILDLFVDNDRAFVRQYIQSFQRHDVEDGVMNDSATFEAQMQNATRSKDTFWMQWTIHHINGYLYCMGHDITNAKANESFLKRREQELSEAQALANMGHWRWVVGSTNLEWSDQIYTIFGVSPEEFKPTLDNANALLHKRDIGHMMQAFQRAIIEQNDYDIDFRVIRPDQTVAYVRCEGRCELDDDGDVIALYGVMQDITEQTEHEMQLCQAKDLAEQAYASKSRFLANMSHELRTPLNAIIGFSDMIKQQMLGPVGSEQYLDYAGNIKDSGEHLLDLITDILDMSKIEAGKYQLDLEDIQLGETVASAISMIECRAREGDIEVVTMVKDAGPQIIADRRAVMQILLNVLSNAVKFTQQNGKITICIEEFENHVTIKVADTGIGIPANKLSAVLLPFEQVSTAFTRSHEGSGLGLAITKELAELHGGMISLESVEHVGTTASIRLPRVAVQKGNIVD